VHTHSSKAGLLGRAAARAARVPHVVHTQHGWSIRVQTSPAVWMAYRLVERVLARATDRIVVVAALDRATGLAHGIGRPGQYTVIRSGIDVAAFSNSASRRREARERLGLPRDAAVVGTVARLAPPKDLESLLHGFAAVAAERPAARLVLIGDGPRRAEAEAMVRALGATDRVVFAGPRRDVPELLPAFDVMVLPSHHEGLPRTIVEAMATGIPVVASGVGGIPEVVVDGTTGLLVPPGDPAALASAVERVLDDPALGLQLVDRARTLVGEFDAAAMVRRTEALYEELLAERAPAPRAPRTRQASRPAVSR
jgi:glycosyltransferase involved in cell wall biosynthesis